MSMEVNFYTPTEEERRTANVLYEIKLAIIEELFRKEQGAIEGGFASAETHEDQAFADGAARSFKEAQDVVRKVFNAQRG